MANQVQTSVNISGPEEEILRFVSENKAEDGLLNMNFSVPAPVFDNTDDQENWVGENWGTDYVEFLDDDWVVMDSTHVETQISSPWAPPFMWFNTISTSYPDLTFVLQSVETGNGFYASYAVTNGEETDFTIYEDEFLGFLESWSEKEWSSSEILEAKKMLNAFADEVGANSNMRKILADEFLYELDESNK